MTSVQIEQKNYEMPPREGISITYFLTVADIERSARYYEKVFGARILSLGDGNAPGYARALHRRLPCGLSAHHCLDFLLPRQTEPTVHLEAWPSIIDTTLEK